MPGAGCRVPGAGCKKLCDGEDAPLAGHAFEHMRFTVSECDTRAGHQVLDRRRHENLARSGERRDALADVDGDSTDVGVAKFDLTGMKSREPRCPAGAPPYRPLARIARHARGRRRSRGCRHLSY